MKASTKYRQRLAQMAGREIPGGCMDCDAYQRVTDQGGGVFAVTVAHDDTCPTYRRMTRGGDGR